MEHFSTLPKKSQRRESRELGLHHLQLPVNCLGKDFHTWLLKGVMWVTCLVGWTEEGTPPPLCLYVFLLCFSWPYLGCRDVMSLTYLFT